MAENTGSGHEHGSTAPEVTLTGVGAVLLMVAAAAVGAAIDALLGPGLGTATTIMLGIATAAGAWLVRRANVASVVIAPPLVYLLLAVATLLLRSEAGVTLAGLAATLVYGFPAMAIATALGIVVVAFRRLAGR